MRLPTILYTAQTIPLLDASLIEETFIFFLFLQLQECATLHLGMTHNYVFHTGIWGLDVSFFDIKLYK